MGGECRPTGGGAQAGVCSLAQVVANTVANTLADTLANTLAETHHECLQEFSVSGRAKMPVRSGLTCHDIYPSSGRGARER
jgi:hypothetical protein